MFQTTNQYRITNRYILNLLRIFQYETIATLYIEKVSPEHFSEFTKPIDIELSSIWIKPVFSLDQFGVMNSHKSHLWCEPTRCQSIISFHSWFDYFPMYVKSTT